MMGKTLVVLLPGLFLQLFVLVGDRPLLPVFMARGLQLVGVIQLMLLLLLFPLLLWELRLARLARTHLLMQVVVLVGTYMRLVIGPLVVFMQLRVQARARLK
jgi:hypothetical protein